MVRGNKIKSKAEAVALGGRGGSLGWQRQRRYSQLSCGRWQRQRRLGWPAWLGCGLVWLGWPAQPPLFPQLGLAGRLSFPSPQALKPPSPQALKPSSLKPSSPQAPQPSPLPSDPAFLPAHRPTCLPASQLYQSWRGRRQRR